MEVTELEPYLLSSPLPQPLPLRLRFFGGGSFLLSRDVSLIRIQTDQGLVRYAPGPSSEKRRSYSTAHWEIEALWKKIFERR